MKQIVSDGYCQTEFFEGGNTQERFVAVLPFFHMYGFHVIMSVTIFQGAFLSCLPRFEPELYIKTLTEHKVNKIRFIMFDTHNKNFRLHRKCFW